MSSSKLKYDKCIVCKKIDDNGVLLELQHILCNRSYLVHMNCLPRACCNVQTTNLYIITHGDAKEPVWILCTVATEDITYVRV
jgi:hypothetical protein